MPEAILFDYDDTLVDTLTSRVPAIIEYCQTVQGVSVTKQDIRSIWGVPFNTMMSKLGCQEEVNFEDYLSIARRYPIVPFSETNEALNHLGGKHTLGIVTSVARSVLLADLEYLGWNKKFEILIAQEDTPYHKPDPRVFEPAKRGLFQLLGREPSLVYIGDAVTDARAAMDAGIPFVGVARSSNKATAFTELGATFKPDLREVALLVKPRAIPR